MNINEFIEKFAEQFDDTALECFSESTKFHELDEWSSMTVLSLIAMIDSEYGVQISTSEIKESITIADLFNVVKNKGKL